jgi:hypothetical protein
MRSAEGSDVFGIAKTWPGRALRMPMVACATDGDGWALLMRERGLATATAGALAR